MTITQDGKAYLRALSYALAAVPTDDDHADLQHVTFIGDRVVGSDGRRRHDGYLSEAFPSAPLSVARISVVFLLKALDYAASVSKARQGTFSVVHRGKEVHIEYGARTPLIHELEVKDVGSHPSTSNEWVEADAPLNPQGLGHIACGDLATAMKWWKSWDKDLGTAEVRGGQEGGPMRVDITAGGRRVATAFVLPADHVEAELHEAVLPMEAVWNGADAPRRGRSNLDLDLSGDGAPPPQPVMIRIMTGDLAHDLNVTGLGNPNEILKTGPCDHRDAAMPCLPCTELEIASRQALRDAPTQPKKRRGKAKQAELEGSEEEFPSHLAPDSH